VSQPRRRTTSASIAAVAVVVVGLMWVGHGLSLGVLGQGAGAPSGADSGSAALAVMGPADGEPLRFGRDVRPILSDRCFLCHGPDRANQQAGLRLDIRELPDSPPARGAPLGSAAYAYSAVAPAAALA
jgi:hypothetical protein